MSWGEIYYKHSTIWLILVSIIKKIFTGPTCKLRLGFTVISDVYRSFIPNKTTFTLLYSVDLKAHRGSFESYWVGEYLVSFTGLASIVNATARKNEQIFRGLGHDKLSRYDSCKFLNYKNAHKCSRPSPYIATNRYFLVDGAKNSRIKSLFELVFRLTDRYGDR